MFVHYSEYSEKGKIFVKRKNMLSTQTTFQLITIYRKSKVPVCMWKEFFTE